MREAENRRPEVQSAVESPVLELAVTQLPWGHIKLLIDKFNDRETRDWYAERAVAEGWSRAVLIDRIAGQLHRRVGAAPSNFDETLPIEKSDLAREMVRQDDRTTDESESALRHAA